MLGVDHGLGRKTRPASGPAKRRELPAAAAATTTTAGEYAHAGRAGTTAFAPAALWFVLTDGDGLAFGQAGEDFVFFAVGQADLDGAFFGAAAGFFDGGEHLALLARQGVGGDDQHVL